MRFSLGNIIIISFLGDGVIHSNYHGLWVFFTLVPWIFTAWAIFLDYLLVRILKLHNEKTKWHKNLIDFILSPIVMLGYNLLAFVALHELVVRGKAVCAHEIAKKDSL